MHQKTPAWREASATPGLAAPVRLEQELRHGRTCPFRLEFGFALPGYREATGAEKKNDSERDIWTACSIRRW